MISHPPQVVVHPNPYPIWLKGLCYLFALFFFFVILYPMSNLIFSDPMGALALLVGYLFLGLIFGYFFWVNFKVIRVGEYLSCKSSLIFEYTKGVYPGMVCFPRFYGNIDNVPVQIDFVRRGMARLANPYMRIPIYGSVLSLPMTALKLKESFLVKYHIKRNAPPLWMPREIWMEFASLYSTKKIKHEIFLSDGLIQYVEENSIGSTKQADRFLAVIAVWTLWKKLRPRT